MFTLFTLKVHTKSRVKKKKNFSESCLLHVFFFSFYRYNNIKKIQKNTIYPK